MAHACENCKFRAHYDAKPNSAFYKISKIGTYMNTDRILPFAGVDFFVPLHRDFTIYVATAITRAISA